MRACKLEGVGEFATRRRMDGEQGLSSLEHRANACAKFDTGLLIRRRAGELCDPGQHAVVDCRNQARSRRDDLMRKGSTWWFAHAALRHADRHELAPGA